MVRRWLAACAVFTKIECSTVERSWVVSIIYADRWRSGFFCSILGGWVEIPQLDTYVKAILIAHDRKNSMESKSCLQQSCICRCGKRTVPHHTLVHISTTCLRSECIYSRTCDGFLHLRFLSQDAWVFSSGGESGTLKGILELTLAECVRAVDPCRSQEDWYMQWDVRDSDILLHVQRFLKYLRR